MRRIISEEGVCERVCAMNNVCEGQRTLWSGIGRRREWRFLVGRKDADGGPD